MTTAVKIGKTELANFHGTSRYFYHNQHMFPELLLTEGAHFLRDKAKCSWLFDAIASHLFHNKDLKRYREQHQGLFWQLKLKGGDNAKLMCLLDIDIVLGTQYLDFTDIGEYTDLRSIDVWTFPTALTPAESLFWVCMLPSEY